MLSLRVKIRNNNYSNTKTMKTTDEPIIVEQIVHASVQNIWNALTDLKVMKQWFFNNIESFKPEVGFETQFMVQVEGRKFTHLWKLTEVIHNKKITYNWKYLEYSGDSFVTFEIIEENNNIKVKVSTKVVENFPSNIPEFERESGVNGWNYFIKKNLKEYLETNRS